jgi:hypothetical protein
LLLGEDTWKEKKNVLQMSLVAKDYRGEDETGRAVGSAAAEVDGEGCEVGDQQLYDVVLVVVVLRAAVAAAVHEASAGGVDAGVDVG